MNPVIFSRKMTPSEAEKPVESNWRTEILLFLVNLQILDRV